MLCFRQIRMPRHKVHNSKEKSNSQSHYAPLITWQAQRHVIKSLLPRSHKTRTYDVLGCIFKIINWVDEWMLYFGRKCRHARRCRELWVIFLRSSFKFDEQLLKGGLFLWSLLLFFSFTLLSDQMKWAADFLCREQRSRLPGYSSHEGETRADGFWVFFFSLPLDIQKHIT